jgi:hypothetical protein
MDPGKSSRPKRVPQPLQRRAVRRQVRSSSSGAPQFLQVIRILPASSSPDLVLRFNHHGGMEPSIRIFPLNAGRLTTITGSVK